MRLKTSEIFWTHFKMLWADECKAMTRQEWVNSYRQLYALFKMTGDSKYHDMYVTLMQHIPDNSRPPRQMTWNRLAYVAYYDVVLLGHILSYRFIRMFKRPPSKILEYLRSRSDDEEMFQSLIKSYNDEVDRSFLDTKPLFMWHMQ